MVTVSVVVALTVFGACVWDEFVETRKVGGLRFVRVGRFGASFWVSKRVVGGTGA